MIMKKTGLVIAAAAAAMILSGCATGARNIPENTPICETPCAAAAPCNTCKCMSSCKQVCPTKKHKRHRHHRRCRAENAQAQMNA
jgi:hypothetical protein